VDVKKGAMHWYTSEMAGRDIYYGSRDAMADDEWKSALWDGDTV